MSVLAVPFISVLSFLDLKDELCTGQETNSIWMQTGDLLVSLPGCMKIEVVNLKCLCLMKCGSSDVKYYLFRLRAPAL